MFLSQNSKCFDYKNLPENFLNCRLFILQDLVNKLIVLDPAKRLTAKQALNHPWVQVSSF